MPRRYCTEEDYKNLGEMMVFIEEQNIKYMRELRAYAQENKPEWIESLRSRGLYSIKAYLQSKRHSTAEDNKKLEELLATLGGAK